MWNENSGSDIWYSRYVSGSWTPSSQVHPDDPSEFYSPEIAVGGGEVWLVWYGHPGADPRYDVFISRWTGTDWAPATMLSGTVPGGAWFCDVAVDASGSPHVVWTDFYDSGKIWYTTLSDESWTDPVGINDPDQVRAGGWASPRIVSDLEAGLHVVWIGAAPPGRLGTRNDLDVFYSRSDGSGWTTPIQVNADDSAEAYYPELAVRNPNDMWIVWSDEGQDWHDAAVVQVAHFDGTSASGQQRLDSGRFQWNQVARVTIDGQGNPWVVWGAIHSDFSESAILYSRFQESVPVYLSNFDWEPREDGVRITWMASEDLFSSFLLERSSQGDSYVEIGRVSASGHGSFGFEDRGVLPGTYLYRLTGVLRDGTTEVFAPMEVRFSVTRLEMWAASPLVRGDVIKLSVQSGSAAEAAFAIFDVEGRQVSTQGPVNLVSGLNEITLQARDRSKQLLGSGVYFVRLTSGDQSLATRFMRVR